MPTAPFSPRGLIERRLNGLATELCEKCGLAIMLFSMKFESQYTNEGEDSGLARISHKLPAATVQPSTL